MKKIVIVIFVLFASRNLHANNFYLNFDYGSDAANGSSTATAWKTWDKIRAYGAGTNYQPGDTISLLKGDTWAQISSYWTGMGSGSPGNHIVLGGWGESTSRPVVETIGTEEQNNYGISLRNMSYWTIQDLFFWNADWAGIYINAETAHVSNIKVYNCEVSMTEAPFHYIRLGTYPASWDVSNIEIGSTTVHGTQSVYGDNTTNIDFVNAERVTSGLWVHNVTGYWGAQQGMLADVAGGDGHIVEYCKARDVGGLLKFHGQQLALTNATGRYNIIYDTPQIEGTNNVAVILQECQNTYVYNNSIYMGNHGIGACMVWDKYPNQLLGVTENLTIQNNIFYGSRESEAAFIVGGNSGTMTQAIFEDKTTCNHNLYYKTDGYAIKLSVDNVAINNGSGSAAWVANHPGDLFVDPLFVNPSADDYHLSWNSPCIDAGIAVNATHTQSLDLDKNPIYGTPDIGCYEYQPPFMIGTDAIDTTGTIRMYSNGKWRYKTGTSSGTLAGLDVYHAAGRLSGTYSQWLDLSFTSWTANKKAWTETPDYGTNTRHVVSGLTNGSSYAVQVNGATQTTKIASGGSISFDQVLGASPVDFEVNLTTGVEVAASGGGSVSASGSGSIVCGAANESVPVVYGVGWTIDGVANLDIGRYAGRKISYRFRAEHTEMANGVRVYLIHTYAGYYSGDGGQILLQLQTDDGTGNHAPSGTVLASSLITDPMAAGYFRHFTFDSPVQLQQGNLYHLVFTNPAPDPVNNYVGINSIYRTETTITFSPTMQPSVSDTDLATLLYRSAELPGWVLWPQYTPIFCLYYNNSKYQGQGYIGAWMGEYIVSISGESKARETFTVSGANQTISKVLVRLKKSGSPGDLAVRLEYSNGALIEEGLIPSSSIKTDYDWATYTFTKRHTLASGSSYNLVLSAPVGDSYQIYAVQDGELPYGFICPNLYKDGHFQNTLNSQWVNFNNRTDYDIQFYFK